MLKYVQDWWDPLVGFVPVHFATEDPCTTLGFRILRSLVRGCFHQPMAWNQWREWYIYWCKFMVNPTDGMCFSTWSFHQCTFEHGGLCFHCTLVSVEISLKTLHFVMIWTIYLLFLAGLMENRFIYLCLDPGVWRIIGLCDSNGAAGLVNALSISNLEAGIRLSIYSE